MSIEELKNRVFTKLLAEKQRIRDENINSSMNLPRALFIDFKSAFDNVVWGKLFGIVR